MFESVTVNIAQSDHDSTSKGMHEREKRFAQERGKA
jgi:hypothetical protein